MNRFEEIKLIADKIERELEQINGKDFRTEDWDAYCETQTFLEEVVNSISEKYHEDLVNTNISLYLDYGCSDEEEFPYFFVYIVDEKDEDGEWCNCCRIFINCYAEDFKEETREPNYMLITSIGLELISDKFLSIPKEEGQLL